MSGYDSADSLRVVSPGLSGVLIEHCKISASVVASLEDGDDWVFVIRTHSLVETALNQLITTALRDERLAGIIALLDTSDKRRGKMAFVKALELLPKKARQFVAILSQL